jgi:serine/threonine protein kinase
MVDCFEDPTYLHIVTEKYTGGELFESIIENRSTAGCFSEVKAARIIRSLLEAVAYLHSRDLVHRGE